jgi:lysophospholipase L1-like esterase
MTTKSIMRDLRRTLLVLLAGGAFYVAIQRFELHEALQPHDSDNPTRPSIAFLGDSHTLIPNWDALLNCRNTANYGIGGDTSEKILQRLDGVISARPLLVVVMAGTNDVLQDIPPETTILNIENIKRKLRDAHIPHIILAPPPILAKASIIDAISDAATLRIPFSSTDLLNDGVHLRSSGYAKWRDAISPTVRQICASE